MKTSQELSSPGATSLPGLTDARSALLSATGRLAQFCDKSEHNEQTNSAVIATCGAELRETGVALLRRIGLSPLVTMVGRLDGLERRNVLYSSSNFRAVAMLGEEATWREFQLVQAQHDASYHADVWGQRKDDQLRHYTLHLAKLGWMIDTAIVESINEFASERAADIAIFGVKLATLAGVSLEPVPVPRT